MMQMSLIGFVYCEAEAPKKKKEENYNNNIKTNAKRRKYNPLARRLSLHSHFLGRGPRQICSCKEDAEKLNKMMESINGALRDGIKPELCQEGEGGTYFMKDDQGHTVAVFKPKDEEPASLANPKRKTIKEYDNSTSSGGDESSSGERGDWGNLLENNISSSDLELSYGRRGIKVGEAAIREVAAFVLDKDHFSGVPITACAMGWLPKENGNNNYYLEEEEEEESIEMEMKVGSLQEFVPNDCSSWDLSFSLFPVEEVHKIGILDLRLFNTDRHGGNILVRRREREEKKGSNHRWEKGDVELIPIDHGFCLPDDLSEAWFEWLTWPQARAPFSTKTKKYIASLNIEDDERKLKRLGIREECIRTMKVSTLLLKKGAERGLTLHQIASLCCRACDGGRNEMGGDEGCTDYGNPKNSSLENLIESVNDSINRRRRKREEKGKEEDPGDLEDEDENEGNEQDLFFEILSEKMDRLLLDISTSL